MSFNPQEVFSSLQSFLGSGYVLLAIIVLLGLSFVKKLIGLIITAAAIFAIWFFCQEPIMEALTAVLETIRNLGLG